NGERKVHESARTLIERTRLTRFLAQLLECLPQRRVLLRHRVRRIGQLHTGCPGTLRWLIFFTHRYSPHEGFVRGHPIVTPWPLPKSIEMLSLASRRHALI